MSAVSNVSNGVLSEYNLLENKISNIDAKLNSIFKRIMAAGFGLAIASSILVVGSISSLTLSAITFAMAGNPVQALLIKGTMIFGACFGLVTIATLALLIYNANEVIKNNPIA